MLDFLLICGVAALSAVLTGFLRFRAVKKGYLDIPNARSSHSLPTPRGGGRAIVICFLAYVAGRWFAGMEDTGLAAALAGGGGLVAVAGYLDDRFSLPVTWRLPVHFAAAFWAFSCLGGAGWWPAVLWCLLLVWCLNLFNFMDGIDGIAALEAVFVACGAAVLLFIGHGAGAAFLLLFALGASCLGFLWWNWPPARIFMGDVGSGFLGFVLAVMALATIRAGQLSLWSWLILGGVFLVDSGVTLARRFLRGEKVYQAHRSHAYQILSRRWRSHLRVTLACGAVNLFWLLPLAWAVERFPAQGPWITVAALGPLVVTALVVGAGTTND